MLVLETMAADTGMLGVKGAVVCGAVDSTGVPG